MAKPALPPKPKFIKPAPTQPVDHLETEQCVISSEEFTEHVRIPTTSIRPTSFRSYLPDGREGDFSQAVDDSAQLPSLSKARVTKSEITVTHKKSINKPHTSSSTIISPVKVNQRDAADCETIPPDIHELDYHTNSYQSNTLENSDVIAHIDNAQTSAEGIEPLLESPETNGDETGRYSRNSTVSTDTSSSNESTKGTVLPIMEHSPSGHSVWSQLEHKALKVAFEIVQTEYDYLQSLNLLLTDFAQFVRGTVPAEELSLLLKGLPEIKMFCEDLYSDLRSHLEQYPIDQRIAPVFLKKGKVLILYVQYVKDFQRLIDTYQSLLKRYPAFSEAVTRFEISPACKKIPLLEYFHKPIQRLPRYPLLLGSYLRALEEDHPDRENAKQALDLVSDVTAKANTTLASLDKVHRLLWYQSRTMDYTFLRPHRQFIRDGVLKKLSRKAPQERTVILCSDALICLERDLTTGKFVLNGEYSLTEIKVDNLLDSDYFDRDLEFALHSQRKSFVFQANFIEERNLWLNAVRRAITERQKMLSHKLSRTGVDNETETLRYAPIWIPDYRVQACQLCKKPFGLFRRYHHCRLCGYAVCGSCSPHEINIDYKDNRSKRVCKSCYARQ